VILWVVDGWQVLRDIAKLGPELLLNVSDVYTMCVASGLLADSPLRSLVVVLVV